MLDFRAKTLRRVCTPKYHRWRTHGLTTYPIDTFRFTLSRWYNLSKQAEKRLKVAFTRIRLLIPSIDAICAAARITSFANQLRQVFADVVSKYCRPLHEAFWKRAQTALEQATNLRCIPLEDECKMNIKSIGRTCHCYCHVPTSRSCPHTSTCPQFCKSLQQVYAQCGTIART